MSNKSGHCPSEGDRSSDSDRGRSRRSLMMINQLLEENDVVDIENYRSLQANITQQSGDRPTTSYAFHALYTVHEETEAVTEVVTQVRPVLTQARPALTQARPVLPQVRPELPQVRPELPQLRPVLPQLRPVLPQLRSALTHRGNGDGPDANRPEAPARIVEEAPRVVDRKPNLKKHKLRVDEMILRSLVVLDNKKGCSLPRLREYMNIAYCYQPKSYRMLKRYLKIGLRRNKLISVSGKGLSGSIKLSPSFRKKLLKKPEENTRVSKILNIDMSSNLTKFSIPSHCQLLFKN